jgi:tetratricopeptide (TPR) repeat protein
MQTSKHVNHKEIADNMMNDNYYEDAIELYTTIITNDENNYKALSNRSTAYIKLGKYELALKDSIKCLKLNPGSGKAWGKTGAILCGLERYDSACNAYIKANNLEPNQKYETMITELCNVTLNNHDKEVVSQEVVSQEVVSQEVVSQEVFSQEVVNQEVVNQEVVSQEVVNSGIFESIIKRIFG